MQESPVGAPGPVLQRRAGHCTRHALPQGAGPGAPRGVGVSPKEHRKIDPSVAPAWLLKGRGWVSLTSGSIVGTSECEMNE